MSRSFTKFTAAILGALLIGGFSSASFAQDNEIIRPITAQGSSAFMFNLNGLGNFGVSGPTIGVSPLSSGATGTSGFGNSEMPGIGFKYFIGQDLALRIGLGAKVYETGDETIAEGKTQRNTEGANLGIEYHFRPLYSTSPYLGAQVSFITDNFKRTHTGSVDFNYKGTSFGVSAFGGFDWFFTRGLAVGAEYGLGFVSTSQEQLDFTTPGKIDKPSNTDVGLGINGNGNLHLTVYF